MIDRRLKQVKIWLIWLYRLKISQRDYLYFLVTTCDSKTHKIQLLLRGWILKKKMLWSVNVQLLLLQPLWVKNIYINNTAMTVGSKHISWLASHIFQPLTNSCPITGPVHVQASVRARSWFQLAHSGRHLIKTRRFSLHYWLQVIRLFVLHLSELTHFLFHFISANMGMSRKNLDRCCCFVSAFVSIVEFHFMLGSYSLLQTWNDFTPKRRLDILFHSKKKKCLGAVESSAY